MNVISRQESYSKTITITKIDAAQRQLKEAIRLWFDDRDPVAIHSLACSAYQIIHDINKQRGGRDLFYDSLVIKDEYQKEWAKRLKASYNFLKHADVDADGVLEFKPALTEAFISYSLFGLELLGQKHDEIGGAYILYLSLHRPEFLTEKGKKQFFGKMSEGTLQFGREIPKSDFFQVYTTMRKQYLLNEGTNV